MESVTRLERTPVRHRGSFKGPARRLILQFYAMNGISLDGIAVSIGAVFMSLGVDSETPGRSRT